MNIFQTSDTYAIPGSVAFQGSLSMEFSRQEYWSGHPFPSPGYCPYTGVEPGSPELQILYYLSHEGCPRLSMNIFQMNAVMVALAW